MFTDIKLAVIVALAEEYHVFMEYFPGVVEKKYHVGNTTVDILKYNRASRDDLGSQIGVVCVNKTGNVAGAIVASQILSLFDLNYIVNLGLAAGVDNSAQSLGDVLIAERIRYYETGKLTKEGFRPSAEFIDVRSSIVNALANARVNSWPLGASLSGRPRQVFFGTIASGDKVVGVGSFVNQLREYDRKTIGIEMESYGIAAAAVGRKEKFLMIRGISDFANAEKHDFARLSAIEGAVRVFSEAMNHGLFDRMSFVKDDNEGGMTTQLFTIDTKTVTRKGITNNYVTRSPVNQFVNRFEFRRELIARVSNKFQLGNFKVFCVALDVDFDELEGATKTEKAASLLAYLERKELMTAEELFALVERY